MDPLWKIALRNVIRHRKRTVITALVMMFGIGLYIGTDSVLAGMDRLTIDTMVSYSSSFLKVRTPEYAANALGMPLDQGIADPAATMAAMREAAPELRATSPRSLFVAQASNYVDAEPVLAAAVDVASDPLVFDLAASVAKGRWLAPGPVREVVVAQATADELGLSLGDGLLLSARTIYDNDNADEFAIVGIVDGSAAAAGTATVYMGFEDARAFLGQGLEVTEIDASSSPGPSLGAELAASTKAAAEVRARLPALAVTPVSEFAKDYLAMRQMKSKGSFMLIFMILLIAGVGIVNTILMSVYARVREIGVLRAYGMTPRDIRSLFTREGLIIGLFGSLAGLGFGALLNCYFIGVGLDIAGLFGKLDLGAIPANAILRGEWRPSAFVIGLVFGVAVAWIAARIPAKRAARLEPTDALRFV